MTRIKSTIMMVAFSFIIFACSKSSISEPQIDPTGNYEGSLSIFLDGKLTTSTNNAQVAILSTSNKNQVNIITGVSVSLKANISSNNITIPRTITSTVLDNSLTEYGTGTLIGKNLKLDINQELKSNGVISTNLRYSFNLTKN